MSSNYSQRLAKTLGILIGECTFGINGPFLFNRLGLSVPEAVATACLIGATAGYGTAVMLIRFRNRAQVATPVRAIRDAPKHRAA